MVIRLTEMFRRVIWFISLDAIDASHCKLMTILIKVCRICKIKLQDWDSELWCKNKIKMVFIH